MTNQIQPPASAVALEKVAHLTLHLTPVDHWEQQHQSPEYLPEAFDVDGFIHCTDSEEEVIAVGNRYYQADPREYVLLDIDCGAVRAPIVYEDALQIFPHIYGPLEVPAIVRVRSVRREADGRFVSIGDAQW